MAERGRQPGREQAAQREIGRTDVSKATAWVLVAAFLGTIFAVPAVQHVHEIRAGLARRRPTARPQCYDIFNSVPVAGKVLVHGEGSVFRRVFDANSLLLRDIHRYEDALEDESLLRKGLLPPAQAVFTGLLGVGNEQAHCGRGGWLFYRPGMDYVTGPGFLEPSQLAKRAESGSEWRPAPQPDPVEAIAGFAAQLAERGITLIIMPTPVKPMIHPEKYSRRYHGFARALQNPSYDEFTRRLAERLGGKLVVFDVAQMLVDRKLKTGEPQFLRADTHWRPGAMEFCAEQLSKFVARHVPLPERRTRWKRRPAVVSNRGDIATMLNLPKDRALFPKEGVRTHQVFTEQDMAWRADESADVLLLGDSFSNVYSFDRMGWGFSAGLAEQLSYYMQRRIDRIVRNDDGACATRAVLSRQLATGRDRLAGKKVVIWQFAIRELAAGDWKLLDMTLRPPRPSTFLEVAPGRETIVSGVIAAITPVPRPYSKSYADYIVAIHLTELEDEAGRLKADQAAVYMWGMRKNVWTEAAKFRADQQVRVRLTSWDELVEKKTGVDKINRGDLGEVELEPICWGEVTQE